MALFQQNKAILILLIVAFTLALLLGYIGVSTQLIFGWDQARDAYEAHAIWNRDIKIQGPSSDIPGVHHGVLWYYFLAIPYAIAGGNPEVVAKIIMILTFLTAPLCAYLAYKLFNDKNLAIIASLLYVFSPLFQATSRWLSNPLLAIFITPMLLLFLWEYIKKQSWKTAAIVGFCFGLLIQSNFAYGIFLFTLPLYFIYFRLKVKIPDLVAFGFSLLLAGSTYILSEIRFDGKGIQSILSYLRESYGSSATATSSVIMLIDRIVDLLYYTVIPLPKLAVFVAILIAIFWLRQQKIKEQMKPGIFLLLWVGSLFFFLFFRTGILHSSHVFTPYIIAVAILAGLLLSQLNRKMLLSLLVLLLVFQTFKLVDWIQHKHMPLSVQPNINYYDEQRLVDYTYQEAQGKPFTITTITNPLYINTTWSYLYEMYGKKKYGYVPYWHGISQAGYLGNLPEKNFATPLRFLIQEPKEGIRGIFIIKATYEEDLLSDVIAQEQFGAFRVEKRVLNLNKPPVATPAALTEDGYTDD